MSESKRSHPSGNSGSAPSRAQLARLREMADSISDKAFGAKLLRVYEAAFETMDSLGEIGLGRYEDMAETGCPDLSLWEQVAPVIRNTVLEVNRLLATIQKHFPAEASGGIADLIDEALEDASGDNPAQALLQRRREEACHHIRVVANALVTEISNLGERIRNPQVVSDRWNLLADIQEFRGKFRSAVGDLIYMTALAFTSASRAEIVPGWADEVRDAIASRRAVIDLARLLAVSRARFNEASGAAIDELVAGLAKNLDAFGRSSSYTVLRAQDKRRIVEFRSLLHRFASAPGVERSAVADALAQFARFTEGLSIINQRACLVEHDRLVFAACGVKLEQAEAARKERSPRAAALLAEAHHVAQDLYGRHPSLDAWLRKARKRDLSKLNGAELDFELELLRELLSSAMAF
ncbi:MAG: hypothetical protein ACOX6T_24635 [Myxococcales bacterium]|jgi:hypothetical protein